MKIVYSDNKNIRTEIAPRDLQANTLYDYIERGVTTQFLIDKDFKCIEFKGNIAEVWNYEDIRQETNFVGGFYLSHTSVTIKN